MSKKIPISVFIFVLLAAILLSFMTAFTVADSMMRGEVGGTSGSENEKLETLAAIIKAYSYYDMDEDTLCASLVNGMYNTVDRYAAYYTNEEYAQMSSSKAGNTQGIGISVIADTERNAVHVIHVTKDSPAEKAGIEAGDRIVAIKKDDKTTYVKDVGYTAAVELLAGEAGTYAEFTVERGESRKKIDFSVLRTPYTSQSVIYRLHSEQKNTAVIKILEFDLTTPRQFKAAMDELIELGAENFVFDVRDNPGGDLASITAVLSTMLQKDDVMIVTKDKNGNEERTAVKTVNYAEENSYAACNVAEEDIGKYREAVSGRSVVITNGSTASAAELFTIVLKDYGIACSVGETTYGKGCMQKIVPLEYYGLDGALKLTTHMYFPPVSEGYDGVGIVPEVTAALASSLSGRHLLTLTDSEDNQLAAAIAALAND